MSTISKACLDDAAELDKLINSAYRGTSSKQGWTSEADILSGIRTDVANLKEIMGKPGNQIMKYTDNRIIKACVLLEVHNDYLYLGMLTVSPLLQGKGIGKKLLEAAESEARKLGKSILHMTVISVRHELIDWYKRHGYKSTGETKPFPTDATTFGIPKMPLEFIVLEKQLNQL